MVPQTNSDDLKREVQATLAGRRELGPAYDEQFIDALVEKLTAQVQQQVRAATPAERSADSKQRDKQRSELAITSLALGIPLVAIGAGIVGPWGLIIVCAMIVGINIAFALGR